MWERMRRQVRLLKMEMIGLPLREVESVNVLSERDDGVIRSLEQGVSWTEWCSTRPQGRLEIKIACLVAWTRDTRSSRTARTVPTTSYFASGNMARA